MNTMVTISIIVGFLVINAVVIKLSHRKQNSYEDYAVGGRSFPWILSMFGFIGSWYTGSTYTGWFGDSANIGLFAQYLAIYSVGTMITLYIMVRPVWIWGNHYNLTTNADLVELRYKNKAFGTFIAITTFLFWSPWLIVECKTIGYLISAATYGAVPFNAGMIVVSLFVITYCYLGGARAGVIGDLVQGLFFIIVGSITILYLFNEAYGGILPMFQALMKEAPHLLVINSDTGYGQWGSAIFTGAIGGMMMPGIFVRLYMTKSVAEAKKGVLLTPLLGASFTILLLWLGMGVSLLDGAPKDMQSSAFWLANTYGGPVALGLMGVFALAASMSTLSSATMTAGVMLGKNLLRFLHLNERQTFTYSRVLTIVIGITAVFIATMEISRMVSLILYLYDCIVQVAIPILLGLYWKRGNVHGAFTGTIAGMLIVILNGSFPWLTSWAGGWSPGIVGLLANLILYIGVSLLTPKQEHVNELFTILQRSTSKTAETENEIGMGIAK